MLTGAGALGGQGVEEKREKGVCFGNGTYNSCTVYQIWHRGCTWALYALL